MTPRSRIDWIAARAVFVGDPTRSYGKVSRQFGVSEAAVRKHAKADNWEAAAVDFDHQATERALAQQVKSRDEHTTRALLVRDQAFQAALDKLASGRLDVKLSDLPAIGKYAELLTGEATDRVEIREVREFAFAFVRFSAGFVDGARRPEFLEGVRELMGSLEPGAEESEAT